MRPSSFQRIDIALSRDLQTDYDKIKLVSDNITGINAVADSITAGDLSEIIANLVEVISLANLSAEILTVAGLETELLSIYADNAKLDSIYADKGKLDSLFADKTMLDSLFADKAVLDSLYADKNKLDSLYADKAVLDSLFAALADIGLVADNIDDITLAVEAAEYVRIAREAMNEPTGFDHKVPSRMGIIELAVTEQAIAPFTSWIVYKIDQNNAFSKLTAQTQWGNGDAIDTSNPNMISIYPVDGSNPLEWFYAGTKYSSTTRKQCVFSMSSGERVIYLDGAGILTEATTGFATIFENYATVASVYGNANTGEKVIFANERHGIVMDSKTHAYLHTTNGSRYRSGLDIVGLTLNTLTYTETASGVIVDEDITLNIGASNMSAFWYIDGGVWRGVMDTNLLAYKVLGATKYNQETSPGTFALTTVAPGEFMLIHFVATNDAEYPIVKILGQQLYATKTQAEVGALTEINSLVLDGLPALEFVFLYTIIVDGNGELRDLEDGSLYADWRSTGVSIGGGSSAGSATFTTTTTVATDGQTVFMAVYTLGLVEVFHNGTKLVEDTEYTATNGTSIVLTSGVAAGDIVEIVAYSTFNVANTYTIAAMDALLANKLSRTGGTMTGAITALRETKVAMGANNIDLATGNVFTKTITGATTLTVSNVLASGNANSFILELTNGGAYAITWFSGIKWSGGTVPTLTASGVDILGFYSHDGGTTYRGIVLAKDSK